MVRFPAWSARVPPVRFGLAILYGPVLDVACMVVGHRMRPYTSEVEMIIPGTRVAACLRCGAWSVDFPETVLDERDPVGRTSTASARPS